MDDQEQVPTPRPNRTARLDAWFEHKVRWTQQRARHLSTAIGARARALSADPRLRRLVLIGGRDVLAALAITFLALGLGRLCFERINPGTVGVLQKNWGAEREIKPVDYSPGVHFAPSFLYSWQRVDTRTRVLSFARPRDGGEYPALEIRTPKGPTAQICARVPYSILPGSAHRVVEDGMKSAYPMRVQSTVEKVLVEELSRLETSGLCQPDLRQAAADAALLRLNAELASLHVRAEGVFVDAVYFAPTFEEKKQQEQLASQTAKTNEVLHQLKLERIDGESVVAEVHQAEQAEVARASREYADEKELWEKRRIADQKIEIELLEQELAREKQARLDELARGFEETRATERDAVLAQLEREHQAASLRIATAQREQEEAQAREIEAEARTAQAELDALKTAGALAAQSLDREVQAERARLELELAQARVDQERALRERQRAADSAVAALRREADARYEALVGEGQAALASAESLRDELEAAALATPGARMLLAREAAGNLNLAHVSLDSNDPRVPSVLDLDALVALLVGEPE